MDNQQRNDDEERSNEAPLVAEPESFGSWLRRQREVREIDLREIADASKVSMSYLRALEEDRFDVLPAPVFAKGFLRQYARYVGLDPEEVVNFYLAARHPEGEEQPLLQPRTAPEPPSRNYLLLALVAVTALVLLVWLLSFLNDRVRSPSDPEAVSPTSAAAASAGAKQAPQLAGALPAGAPEESEPTARPSAPQPAAYEPALPPPAAHEPDFPEATSRVPLLVTLDFISDCWVEASVDGRDKISVLKVQGESLLLEAENVVEFKVGDVGAVQVEVNGRPFQIEEREGTSVRRVRIDLESAAAPTGGPRASSDNASG